MTRINKNINVFIHSSACQVSRIVRKPDLCLCENKGADQLRGNREADQCLCFRYTDSIFPLLLISYFKLLARFCDCTGRFVSDLVVNPEDRFSHVAAQVILSAHIIIEHIFFKTRAYTEILRKKNHASSFPIHYYFYTYRTRNNSS